MPHDVAVIGGGPAGLSAALNAAAEGLDTILLCETMGGQAGTSSRIENYAGFPEGISGPALINRMRQQAEKFGAHLVRSCVRNIEKRGECFFIQLASGSIVRSRSIIIATGALYNKLPVTTPFEGRGVHYACTQTSVRRSCRCDDVVVVGGGNSAGQAAMFLSTKAKKVHILVRKDSLAETMSSYLHERIVACDNIDVHFRSQIDMVRAVNGEVESVDIGGKTMPVSDIYVMIGASPNTKFLEGIITLDKKGFVCTNDAFRTDIPGIYAVGDVRQSSVKRVANAAGEGAACVPKVWEYLNP